MAPDNPVDGGFGPFVVVVVLILVSVTSAISIADSFVLTTITYLVVAVVAVGVTFFFDVGSPGPYFFVLMVGDGTLLGVTGMTLGSILPYILLGKVLSVVFGMVDLLYDRYGSERRAVADAEKTSVSYETPSNPSPTTQATQ